MVHIPKCAGGSINRWFKNNVSNYTLYTGHRTLDKFEKSPNFDFSFCVTRNTYDRVVSWYEWLHIKTQKEIRKENNIEINLKVQEILKKGFYEWLKWSFENTEIDQSQLTTLQNEWIKGVDVILKLETLNEDFKIIQNHVNCHIPLEKSIHVLQYNKNNYLTDKNIGLINELFKEEIEYFNYKPNTSLAK